jgi:hypothetical protein
VTPSATFFDFAQSTIDSGVLIITTTYRDLGQKPCQFNWQGLLQIALEPISKISPAADDDIPAATSSKTAKKSSVYLKGYASGCSARFPRLAEHLLILATKLFLRWVLEKRGKNRSQKVSLECVD